MHALTRSGKTCKKGDKGWYAEGIYMYCNRIHAQKLRKRAPLTIKPYKTENDYC